MSLIATVADTSFSQSTIFQPTSSEYRLDCSLGPKLLLDSGLYLLVREDRPAEPNPQEPETRGFEAVY